MTCSLVIKQKKSSSTLNNLIKNPDDAWFPINILHNDLVAVITLSGISIIGLLLIMASFLIFSFEFEILLNFLFNGISFSF